MHHKWMILSLGQLPNFCATLPKSKCASEIPISHVCVRKFIKTVPHVFVTCSLFKICLFMFVGTTVFFPEAERTTCMLSVKVISTTKKTFLVISQ